MLESGPMEITPCWLLKSLSAARALIPLPTPPPIPPGRATADCNILCWLMDQDILRPAEDEDKTRVSWVPKQPWGRNSGHFFLFTGWRVWRAVNPNTHLWGHRKTDIFSKNKRAFHSGSFKRASIHPCGFAGEGPAQDGFMPPARPRERRKSLCVCQLDGNKLRNRTTFTACSRAGSRPQGPRAAVGPEASWTWDGHCHPPDRHGELCWLLYIPAVAGEPQHGGWGWSLLLISERQSG